MAQAANQNKLERSSHASLFSLVYFLWVTSEPTRVEHLSGRFLHSGRPSSQILDKAENSLKRDKHSIVFEEGKKFYNIATWWRF